ncbi:type-F conjugative transfer system secretin TraK [Photobacterium sp. R1]
MNVKTLLALAFISFPALSQVKNVPATTYTFNDNETLAVTLSSVDVNRLIVKDDKISSIDCPAGFCVVTGTKSDKSGSAKLKLNIQARFVAYVSTVNGRQFGILINPRPIPAVTSEFIGVQNTISQPSVFDNDAPYQAQLAEFTAQMIRWTETKSMMSGFRLHPVDPKTVKDTLNDPLAIVPDTIFVGKDFSGIRYKLINNTNFTKELKTAQFYSASSRSAALSQEVLQPGESCWLYIVTGGRP